MGQGAWHEANMSGDKIDHGGCVNTLTTLRPSPLAKGKPQHTSLVEIEKIFWFTAVDGCVVGGEWSPDRMRRIAGMAPFSVVNTFS